VKTQKIGVEQSFMQILNEITSATCPACGLMCDDLAVNTKTGERQQYACKKAINFYKESFSASTTTHQAYLKGAQSDLETALASAATILKNSQQPLFAGLGTEVNGMRAVIDLAKKANATLDHMHSEGTVNNTLSIQNIGYQTTTMTEVKNRADVILFFGTETSESHPRFFEKLVWNKDSLFNKRSPKVIFLGVPKETPMENFNTAISPTGEKATVIHAEKSALPEIANALNTLLNGKNPIQKMAETETIAGVTIGQLKSVVETLKNAQYGVVVWSASSLKAFGHSELTIQSLIRFINKLNETNRVAGLPLNSGDGDTTVNNTSAWVTGYATRNRFIRGEPSFDARAFSTKKIVKECDALLWISTFNATQAPKTNAPTIVIGHPNSTFETPPDVFIPVAVPGVHQSGLMFRMDSSVTLPLRKITENTLPTLASVLQKIEALLA